MNAREFTLVVIGLVVGLAVGMIIITGTTQGVSEDEVRTIVQEANSDLRESILNNIESNTNGNDNGREFQTRDLTDSTFYLVTMEQTASWLQSEAEEREESFELPEAVTEVINQAATPQDSFTAAEDIELFFEDQVNSANGLLANAYNALALNLGDDTPFNVCLGLDNDPYSLEGPIIYLYLEVPDDRLEDMPPAESKDEWEQLDGPREESMLWTAECYDPEAVEEEETEATEEPTEEAESEDSDV